MKKYLLIGSLLTLTSLGAFAQSFNEVSACDVTFNLPAHLKITKPKRWVDEGVAQCGFKIVPSKPVRTAGECKDKEEGGSPPYKVCDWLLSDFDVEHNVVVARINLRTDKRNINNFSYEDGNWSLPNAQGSPQPAEEIDFYGKPGFQATWTMRGYWGRNKIHSAPSIYAGSYDLEGVLLQLAPNLAVALLPAPSDDENHEECTIFCSSLRPAIPRK